MSDIDFSKIKKKKKYTENANESEGSAPTMQAFPEVEPLRSKINVLENASITNDSIDFSKSKKKKKAKFHLVEDVENMTGGIPEEFEVPIDYTNKRKKRKAPFEIEGYLGGEADDDGEAFVAQPDYNYEKMLERVYNLINEKNPELLHGEKKRLRMVPPSLARVGTKKTLFANFLAITKMIKRDSQHVMQFLLNEMGTTGSIDQNSQLLIRGRYQSKQIESLLKNYCRSYVICKTCQSPDTQLSKDSRLLFLICNSCGSKYSVDTHTAGFQAVTTKRAAIRAKNQ